MIRAVFLRLRSDKRGSVTTEFALWTTLLFLVIMGGLDFGGYYIERSAINEAISAGAVQAFQSRDEAPFTDLPGYIRNVAGDQSLSVALSCNGVANSCVNDNRTCACLKTDATFVAADSCGSPCGSGATANSVSGYYLTIKASRAYNPVLLPNGTLDGVALDQSATVRLQ